MNSLKYIGVLIGAIITLPLMALDNVEVTDVKARQRYPWNGKVDIDFTLDSKATEPYQMQVEVYDNVGKTNLPVKSVCTENVSVEANPCMVRTDTTRIVWDAAKDLPNGFKCTNVLVSCKDARLTPVDKLYCVIDLTDGTKEYLSGIPQGGWTDEHKTTKMVFRRIEAGSFMMGSPSSEVGRQSNETQHKVTITKPYYIAIFELTEAQYCEIVGGTSDVTTPKRLQYGDVRGLDWGGNSSGDPAKTAYFWPQSVNVDPNSCVGRFRTLTEITTIDMPTEAQWEFAARAESQTALNTGCDGTTDAMKHAGRYDGNKEDKRGDASCLYATTVGSYTPNAFGIYDMHGNVREWCLDVWSDDLGSDEVSDPIGGSDVVTKGTTFQSIGGGSSYYSCRVVKGGGYYDHYALRSGYSGYFINSQNVSGAALESCRSGARTYGRSCGACWCCREYTCEGIRLVFSEE